MIARWAARGFVWSLALAFVLVIAGAVLAAGIVLLGTLASGFVYLCTFDEPNEIERRR